MFGAQFVQDVGGVEAGVVAQLPGDDLQGLGVRSDQQLLFPGDGPGVIPQVLGQLHLNGSSTRYDGVVLEIGNKFSQFISGFQRTPPKKFADPQKHLCFDHDYLLLANFQSEGSTEDYCSYD